MKLKKLILLLSGTALAIGLASSNAMAYEQDRREHRDMQSHGDRYPAREHHEDRDRHDHRDYRQAERHHHHWYRPEPRHFRSYSYYRPYAYGHADDRWDVVIRYGSR